MARWEMRDPERKLIRFCSKCGGEAPFYPFDSSSLLAPFCLKCGAKMEGWEIEQRRVNAAVAAQGKE